MNLVQAAEIMERLQRRSATPDEFEALQTARDALLTIVSEGYFTIGDRVRDARLSLASQPGQSRPETSALPWLD